MRAIIAASICVEIVIAAALASCQTATVIAVDDASAVRAGEQVFKEQCAVCHSIRPDKKIVGRSL